MSALRPIVAVFVLVGFAAAQQPVSFATEDGVLIHADLYGDADRGVVLAHGGRRTKLNWKKQAQTLVNAGFRVIAFDFRGYGQSLAGRSGGDGVRFDVLAAVRYLRDNGAKTVSVVGASFGGWAAAQASVEARPGEIDRLVILAGEIDDPEKVNVRKLFIVTRDDATDAGPRLPRIRKQYERAPGPKELVVLDGSAHAQFVFETEQGERLMHEIVRFLTQP